MKQQGIPLPEQTSPLKEPFVLQKTILPQQSHLDSNQKYHNVDKLKEICSEIERKQEQIDQERMTTEGQREIVSTSQNPALTEWLHKIAKYTEEIMNFGEHKIDNLITLQFIQEGEAILF